MPKGATAAPYKIFKQGDKWVVKNNMGEKKAEFDSEEAARDYQKALYARVPGAAKAAEKKDFTGKQKRAVRIKASRSEPAVDKVLRLAWSDSARAAAAASRRGKGGPPKMPAKRVTVGAGGDKAALKHDQAVRKARREEAANTFRLGPKSTASSHRSESVSPSSLRVGHAIEHPARAGTWKVKKVERGDFMGGAHRITAEHVVSGITDTFAAHSGQKIKRLKK